MKTKKIRLGVNIDHAATLRQVRGGETAYPDLLLLTKSLKKSGADQITIHLREDRRHIQDADVKLLTKKSHLKINLEMAVTPAMLKIALKNKPAWVCYVPEKREELTTEGGLNVLKKISELKSDIQKLHKKGIRVSLFIEPDIDQVLAAREVGADAVEFHTGRWVLLKNQTAKNKEWSRLAVAAQVAHDLELGVHAGHGLDYFHTQQIRKLPYLAEVNIGHSMICYSIFDGIQSVTRKMIRLLQF